MKTNQNSKTKQKDNNTKRKAALVTNNHSQNGLLNQVFDKCLKVPKKYICFYDKHGILEGGLWVLFQPSACCVLKILTDPKFGDIILCISSDKSYEDIANSEPDPQSIVGFAVMSPQEPDDVGNYLSKYWSRIKQHLPKIHGYQYLVYHHVLNKLQEGTLQYKTGLTMQKGKVEGIFANEN